MLKHVINKMAPRVGCFAGFCHHCLMTTDVHTRANRYPLLECGMKKVLRINHCWQNRDCNIM